jgi:NitT/TauT family transport system substrate-binding protein
MCVTLATVLAFAPAAIRTAHAEVSEVRIIFQPSLTSLPFMLMQKDKLIEKHARASGLGEIATSWLTVAGGNVSNDAMISGNVDFVAAGLPAFLTLMARAKGRIDIKAIAAYNALPLTLLTRNPKVKSIKDFTEKDRIALPAVKASIQAIALQIAAAKAFGPEQFGKLDGLTVSRSHPDAMAAFLAERSEITAHFSAPPYTEDELKVPGVRAILTTEEAVGGPLTSGLAYTTAKFRQENPKLYAAFLAALRDSIDTVNADKGKAAEAYLAISKEKRSLDEIVAIISQPGFNFGLVPQNSLTIAKFMNDIGSIKLEVSDWKELFFPEIHTAQGS